MERLAQIYSEQERSAAQAPAVVGLVVTCVPKVPIWEFSGFNAL
jgi:hypothetical protein